ncbi:hypothetical protein CHO01_31790 [Cellulomonas hominis]|uniref:Uncharacterized protein n=1 Tax=Cellulomonas hominis TaxID=156981 RepID=A0A511FFS0_9CELL|nr:hypothetical protein [Cellulomonas hominis]MBB5474839.1 hypothetical protein [Cellulomonas hominis]NKY05635.1 hypothetical protein [Cellulomonas hominis]GEL48063.1 hypothetical protein CHO01_31790 [Cellulomonas hominis]
MSTPDRPQRPIVLLGRLDATKGSVMTFRPAGGGDLVLQVSPSAVRAQSRPDDDGWVTLELSDAASVTPPGQVARRLNDHGGGTGGSNAACVEAYRRKCKTSPDQHSPGWCDSAEAARQWGWMCDIFGPPGAPHPVPWVIA